MFEPDYVFDGEPAPGETWEVKPGVRWLRMPLPFKLNHINLWILEDGDGWTIVDTGLATDETKQAWDDIASDLFKGRPLKRVIVTHFHPDHLGLAGWLTEKYDVPLWMPLLEWTMGRMIASDTVEASGAAYQRFYKGAGFDDDMLATLDKRIGRFGDMVSTIPGAIHRILDNEVIVIGDYGWRVITGTGHAPEHACLYCDDLDLLISGDQILPRISPNVSVWPQQPFANPLAEYIHSMGRYRPVMGGTLVLPSHDWPFLGLHARLKDLSTHHEERLEATLEACTEPSTGIEIQKRLFTRELDNHQLFFAIGETLAHVHYLENLGRITRRTEDGVHIFTRS